VYFYTSEHPIVSTYAFAFFVEKETKQVSSASAPYSEDHLKWIQENCEKISISVA
jgi:phage gp46-like protein